MKFITWPGMPDGDAIVEAGRRIGRRIETTVVASNEALDELLASGGPFDLITPSDYLVERMRAEGRLAELDHSRLPRIGSIASWAAAADYDPGCRYSVPLAFGTTGLLYDRQVCPEIDGTPSWQSLFKPSSDRTVGLLEEVRETVGAALLLSGHSPNSVDPIQLEDARRVLADSSASVGHVSSEDFVDPVLDGAVAVHHAWSGPAALATLGDDRFGYALPAEGALMWVTTAAIPADAPAPEDSYALLAELMEPELASLATRAGGYSTPNEEARDKLPTELRDSPALFPDPGVLARCHILTDVGLDGEARMADVMRAAGLTL